MGAYGSDERSRAGIVSQPEQSAMGSTPYCSATPINRSGLALPQHIEIDRDDRRCVRVGGRA